MGVSERLSRARYRLSSHWKSSFIRNAYYLMTSSVATAGLGYLYWIIGARLFSAENIGFTAAVFAAAGLIISIADMGLGIASIRYLSSAGDKRVLMINSIITVTTITSLVIAVLFLLLTPYLARQFLPIIESIPYILLFLLFVVAHSNLYTMGSIFTGLRTSKYSFLQDVTTAVCKIIFLVPIGLMYPDGPGLLMAGALAMCIAGFYAIRVSLPAAQPSYCFQPVVSTSTLVPMVGYSLSNYVARIFLEAHTLLFPIISLELIGSRANAAFYLAWITSMILRVIPSACFNSLFAEGSSDIESVSANVRRAIKITLLLLVPACGIMVIGAEYILQIIGAQYALEGTDALRLLVLANIPWSINYLAITWARIHRSNVVVIVIASILLISSLGASYFFMPIWGATGGGVSYLFGQIVTAGFVLLFYGYQSRFGAARL